MLETELIPLFVPIKVQLKIVELYTPNDETQILRNIVQDKKKVYPSL
jgi:hypothetical protein